jgi:hypothetical protein
MQGLFLDRDAQPVFAQFASRKPTSNWPKLRRCAEVGGCELLALAKVLL